MAHRAATLLGLGALVLGLSGCNSITVIEARSGKVIDSQTMAPIAGAYVRVESWMIERPTMTPVRMAKMFETRTDGEGKWLVPRDTDVPKLANRVEAVQTFVEKYYFSAEGYDSRDFQPRRGSGVEWKSPRIPSQVLLTPQ